MSDLNSTTDHLVDIDLRHATSGAGDIYLLAIGSKNVDDEREVYLLTRADLNQLRDLATDALLNRLHE